MNKYNRASIAGCTAGLKNIDWGPVLSYVSEYDEKHPTMSNDTKSNTGRDIVGELKYLKAIRDSGDLSESEYTKAKEAILKDY